jgi:hypothetical protein
VAACPEGKLLYPVHVIPLTQLITSDPKNNFGLGLGSICLRTCTKIPETRKLNPICRDHPNFLHTSIKNINPITNSPLPRLVNRTKK